MSERYAIVRNGVVSNIAAASPEFAASQGWIACPADVSVGHLFDGESFLPAPPAPSAVPPAVSMRQARLALDPSNGAIQYKTLSANTTFTESIADGEVVTLAIDDGTGYTITWPTITWMTDGGSAPTLKTSGYTFITLMQMNGTLYGFRTGDGG